MGMIDILKLAFWTAVFFLALSFFGISIQKIIESPAGQANLSYLADLAGVLWKWLLTVIERAPEMSV